MRYIPDTNIFIALTRHGDRNVKRRFHIHRTAIGLSTVVHYELAFGAFSSDRQEHHLATLHDLPFERLAFDEDDARVAAEIRAVLDRAGKSIGPYDVLIAGQALARDMIVVTKNTREFSRVEGLRLEDWTSS